MIKKKIFIWLSLFLIAVLFLLQSIKKNAFQYATFKTQSGWGYNILVKNRIVIHQETIPSIATEKSFSSQMQASKAAKIVSAKLTAGKMPSLSTTEIRSILEEQ